MYNEPSEYPSTNVVNTRAEALVVTVVQHLRGTAPHGLADHPLKFAFRIELSVMIFIIAGGLAFIVGALTVGYKSYRAAIINPIRTLRDE